MTTLSTIKVSWAFFVYIQMHRLPLFQKWSPTRPSSSVRLQCEVQLRFVELMNEGIVSLLAS